MSGVPDRLTEIEARVKAATEGPWWPGDGESADDVNVWNSKDMPARAVAHDIFDDPDREFIAHAREDVPWLVGRVRDLEEALGQIVAITEPRPVPGGVAQSACGHVARAVKIARNALAGARSGSATGKADE